MNARLALAIGCFFVSGFCFGKAHSAHQRAKELQKEYEKEIKVLSERNKAAV